MMRLALSDLLKWTRIAVVGPDVIVNRFGQIANAAKGAAPDSLTCDLVERGE